MLGSKGVILAAKPLSETKRVRYLLGLCSTAEREHIEAEYFENDDAFQEMLTTENDLIDAYARGELEGEERRGFEKSFVSSSRGRERVQLARAFAGAISAPQPVKTKLRSSVLYTLQSPGLLRTATSVTVIVLVAMLAWLVIDRRRLTNELRELHAESAELSKRTETLPRSRDIEGPRTALLPEQRPRLRAQPDKPRHPERGTTTTLRAGASLATAFEIKITEIPVLGRKFENLISLQPGTRNMSSSGDTSVRGIAIDPMGKAVRGATVTLTDSVRNFSRSQFTNENGAYVFNTIPPGTYSIEVQARGFKTLSASGLAALVDTPTVMDVQLEAGAGSQTVNVTAAAEAPINTSDAVGNSLERRRITELPLNANNVVGLLSLQPGFSRTGSVNGGRADQSGITLAGVYATTVHLQSSLSWIRFQIALETAAIHEDYRVTVKTVDGRPVTSVDWSEPLTPDQTIIDTPYISTADLPSGDYVLLLMGKQPDGSFVKVAEYSFKVIKYLMFHIPSTPFR